MWENHIKIKIKNIVSWVKFIVTSLVISSAFRCFRKTAKIQLSLKKLNIEFKVQFSTDAVFQWTRKSQSATLRFHDVFIAQWFSQQRRCFCMRNHYYLWELYAKTRTENCMFLFASPVELHRRVESKQRRIEAVLKPYILQRHSFPLISHPSVRLHCI